MISLLNIAVVFVIDLPGSGVIMGNTFVDTCDFFFLFLKILKVSGVKKNVKKIKFQRFEAVPNLFRISCCSMEID